nr:hypothetical protein [Tanacetum cinerariifolium]
MPLRGNPDCGLPKYSLTGFTWAFKTGILETYRVWAQYFFTREERYPRAVAWRSTGFSQGGPRMFTAQISESFFEDVQMTPTYPTSFDQSMPSLYPSSYPATPHIVTAGAQQGFVSWSSTYPATADKSRNKMRNANILTFDLGKAVDDGNARNDEPEPVFLDCHIKGYRAMESFWQELVPLMYKGGHYKVDDPNKVGWLVKHLPNRDGSTYKGNVGWIDASIPFMGCCRLGVYVDQCRRGEGPRVQGDINRFFNVVGVDMLCRFYQPRCEDSTECGYD